MIDFIRRLYNNIAPVRYKRIKNYVETIEENSLITDEKNKEIVDDLRTNIDSKIAKIKGIIFLNIFFYVGAYFSFVSFLFSDFLLLSEITLLIGKIVSFFGTTVFLIGIFVTNRINQLHYEDLALMAAHLISLYSQKGNTDEHLFKDNIYRSFIELLERKK